MSMTVEERLEALENRLEALEGFVAGLRQGLEEAATGMNLPQAGSLKESEAR